MSTRETYNWRFVFFFFFGSAILCFFYHCYNLLNFFLSVYHISLTLCFNLCLRRLFEMVEELRSPYMMLLLVMLYPLTLVTRYAFCHFCISYVMVAFLVCYLVLNWYFLGPCWWSFDHWSLSCNWWIKYDWGEQDCKSLFLSCGE